MDRRKYSLIGIIIIAIAAAEMGAMTVVVEPLTIPPVYAQQQEGEEEEEEGGGAASTPQEQIRAAVQAELEDEANIIPGTAVLFIYSNTEWTGTIIDSNPASTPHIGAGDDRIEFACEGGIFKL